MDPNIGRRVHAQVTRVEEYALYLRFDTADVIVLVPDVADGGQDLKRDWRVGDEAEVRIWRYIESKKIYKGTIKEAALDTAEPGPSRPV